MGFYEDYNNSMSGLASAIGSVIGGVGGAVAANELVYKPAAEKKALKSQLDQAIFNQDFAAAALIAQKLKLIDSTWDYQTAERDVVKSSSLTDPPVVAVDTKLSYDKRPPGMPGENPEPVAPVITAPLGFYAAGMSGQNLATNPLGLKGTTASLPSLVPGKVATMTGNVDVMKDGVVPPTGHNRKGAGLVHVPGKMSYQDAPRPPQTWADLSQQQSVVENLPTNLMDFTMGKEIYKTNNLADTEANRKRLMSLYGGEVPKAEVKTDLNGAILRIQPGYGFNKTIVETMAPGGISETDKAQLRLRAEIEKLRFAGDEKDRALRARELQARIDFQNASLALDRAKIFSDLDSSPDSFGLNKEEAKILKQITSEAARERQAIAGPMQALIISKAEQFDEKAIARINAGADAAYNAALVSYSQAYAGDNPRIQKAVESILAGRPRRARDGEPAPTPAPTATLTPPPSQAWPQGNPAPAVRPTARPPVIPQNPTPPPPVPVVPAARGGGTLNQDTAEKIPPSLRSREAQAATGGRGKTTAQREKDANDWFARKKKPQPDNAQTKK